MNFVNQSINNATHSVNNSSSNNFNYNEENDDEYEEEYDEEEEEEYNDNSQEIEINQDDGAQENNEEILMETYLHEKKKRIMNLNEFQFKNINLYFKDFNTNSALKERVGNCSICLNDFVGTDIVKQFSCDQHIFHKKCLLNWLKKSDICPLCKESIMKNYNGWHP